MGDLIYSLNVTMPLFVMVILGYMFKQRGFFTDSFVKTLNSYVFKAAIPCSLFLSLAGQDFSEVWDTGFAIFCAIIVIVEFLGGLIIARVFFQEEDFGEFVQVSYRSNISLLGLSFITNIYGQGNIARASLMICVASTLFNSAGVFVMAILGPGGLTKFNDYSQLKNHIIKNLVFNPLLWGIILGIIWRFLNFPKTGFVINSVNYIANTATPLGLMAVGAGLNLEKVKGEIKPVVIVVFLRLIAWSAVFLSIGIALGYRQIELISVLALTGTPCAVASYVTAINMGHEGVLTSSSIVFSTLICSLTLTGWLFLLRILEMI